MLSLPASVRLFVAAEPIDFRKGVDKLVALARHVVCEDPLSGHVFLFYNRRRNGLRALWWDRTGYILLYKRLERGTFSIPAPRRATDRRIEIDPGELHLLLEGMTPSGERRGRRWYRTPHKELAERNSL